MCGCGDKKKIKSNCRDEMLRREMFPAELCVLIRDEPFLSLSMLFFRDHGSQNEVHEFPMQVHQCLLWSGN